MRYKTMIVAILVACSAVSIAQQVLNNDTIIKMHAAGLGDEIVISTINSQLGTYDTNADNLIVLKKAGVSDKVISAIITKNISGTQPAADSASANIATTVTGTPLTSASTVPAQSPTPIDYSATESTKKPRVFLQSVSSGNTVNARRDQSMEMGKDFERDCPYVRISINQQIADYTVVLNHIEVGLFVRDNQIQIADKDGDLIAKTKEGGSIAGGVKKACALILADWAKK